MVILRLMTIEKRISNIGFYDIGERFMKTFDFIQIVHEIDYNRRIYSYVAVPTPDENYEATLKYYGFPNMKNVEMRINPMSNNTFDKVYVYLQ